MKILNVEDDVIKQSDITRQLERCGIKKTDIDWVDNLEDAIKKLSSTDLYSYDLIITDMYYPLVLGGTEEEAGDKLIEYVKNNEILANIPIIVCSSAKIKIKDILGTVHYSAHSDWEDELSSLIQKIKRVSRL